MKNQICILIFFIICGFAKSQNCFGEYFVKSEFCSNTISLWPDSTFFWEYGCEGRSNIQTGIFTVKGDEIYFRTIELDSFELIFNVEWVDSLDKNASKIPQELLPSFFLVDRNDEVIKGIEAVCYNIEGDYMSVIDERNGWLFFSVNEATELYFPFLSKIFREFVRIEIPPNPEEKFILKITLNIESTFLNYSMVKFRYNKRLVLV
ncbi:MAG: hypothetical protein R3D00_05340 [Bacteroidia bacterium]